MSKSSPLSIAVLIGQLLADITAIGPAGIELFLKLQSLFSLGPDEQANVTRAIQSGLAADQETLDAIEAWKKQVGL